MDPFASNDSNDSSSVPLLILLAGALWLVWWDEFRSNLAEIWKIIMIHVARFGRKTLKKKLFYPIEFPLPIGFRLGVRRTVREQSFYRVPFHFSQSFGVRIPDWFAQREGPPEKLELFREKDCFKLRLQKAPKPLNGQRFERIPQRSSGFLRVP